MTIIDAITKYNFDPAGSIVHPADKELPKFEFNSHWISNKTTGLVYLWVKYTNNVLVDIAYVGKAGRTLRMRCGQHHGGWRESLKTPDIESNRTRIISWLAEPENSIQLFARVSPVLDINDEKICSYSIDEESFIKKFRNMNCALWNS